MMDVFKTQENSIMELKETEDKSKEPQFIHQDKHKIQSQLLSSNKENPEFEQNFEHIIGILNNQFYLIKNIGKGSTGSVFLSYSIQEKKHYAIKIIDKKDPSGNFINNCEVNFLEKMNHKNILKVYGHGLGLLRTSFGLSQQVYYIIMDYLDHGSLLSQINGNIGFGEDFGRLILAQLLDGLEAIHNSNIVHRDIKLENIMISGNDYTLKYVDFGFATEKSNGHLNTFLGTPNYAAPELHLKQPYLGVYEDIFSLGVTLFIVVTGHLPFLLPLPDDPLYHHIFCVDYVNYWRNRKVKVSPSFMELFDNLIAFNPTQRPSISEIRKSKWMQEINWNLLPFLKQEFLRREEILNQKNINAIQKITFIKNENMKNIIPTNINNNLNNFDELLLKIKEEKRIDVVNDIKNQLFLNSNINGIITNKDKKNINESIENICKYKNELKSSKKNSLKGFIIVQKKIKNMNSLIIALRQFLKGRGFNITNKKLDKLTLEISNGEVDVFLFLEKIYKEVKINFTVINGNKEDLLNFNKIMKKFSPK